MDSAELFRLKSRFYNFPKDDPLIPNIKTAQRFKGDRSGKHRVYCKMCFDKKLDDEKNAELAKKTSIEGYIAKEDAELKRQMWTANVDNQNSPVGLVSSNTDTMRNHLAVCPLQPQAVRDEYIDRKKERNFRRAGKAIEHLRSSSLAPRSFIFKTRAASTSNRMPVDNSIQPSVPYSTPYPVMSTHSLSTTMGQHTSDFISPSDSASNIGSPPIYHTFPHSYSAPPTMPPTRPSSRQSSYSGSYLPSVDVQFPQETTNDLWDDTKKARYEQALIRLVASCNLPLNIVENPEFNRFREEFIPGSPYISRRVLGGRVLKETAENFTSVTRENLRNRDITLQSDGWTGLNHHHLVATMASVNETKKVYTVQVKDITERRRFAQHMYDDLTEIYDELTKNWKTRVVAIVTDAAGEARLAKRMFGATHPEIATLDCYAHQINLIVGDYFKSRSPVKDSINKAMELISWIRSKPRILHALSHIVIRAVLTRWSTHYQALRRLLTLSTELEALVKLDRTKPKAEQLFVASGAAANSNLEKAVDTINSGVFWHDIALVTHYLEPLAIAANITQASCVRMDQVLVTFGFLVKVYSSEAMAHDLIARNVIIKSIEMRWNKADQQLFIAAMIVNPFFRMKLFSWNAARFNIFQVLNLLRGLYARFFTIMDDLESKNFDTDAQSFLNGNGMFDGINDAVDHALASAYRLRVQPDPITIYRHFEMPGYPIESKSSFAKLALHILSISANSASCERLFSVYGNILTKLRNRLSTSTMSRLGEIKLHVRDEHVQLGKSVERQKRWFGTPDFDGHTEKRMKERQIIDETVKDLFSRNEVTTTTNISNDVPESSFSGILHSHSCSATADLEDTTPFGISNEWDQISISNLFDMTSEYWTDLYERFAVLTYEDELSLYELVEKDAEGEIDDGALDDSTGEILIP